MGALNPVGSRTHHGNFKPALTDRRDAATGNLTPKRHKQLLMLLTNAEDDKDIAMAKAKDAVKVQVICLQRLPVKQSRARS